MNEIVISKNGIWESDGWGLDFRLYFGKYKGYRLCEVSYEYAKCLQACGNNINKEVF